MSNTNSNRFAVITAPGFGWNNNQTDVHSTHGTLAAAKRACNDRTLAIIKADEGMKKGDFVWSDTLKRADYLQIGRKRA